MASSSLSQVPVRTAVRVRPLNVRERREEAKVIVEVKGNTATLQPPGQDPALSVEFDNVFSSHDSSSGGDQEAVFSALSGTLLDSVWEGIDGTALLYGSTASGKSYTMMGPSLTTDADLGLAPRLGRSLMTRCAASQDHCLVKVSHAVIRREQLSDLLADPSKRPQLKVTDTPRGPQILNLTKRTVTSVQELDDVMDEGRKALARQQGGTARVHSILTLELVRTVGDDELNLWSEPVLSKLTLVDLAGSERVCVSQSAGARFDDAHSQLVPSLVALSQVVRKLGNRGKAMHVPFLDSSLTRLLRESLMGNCSTVVVGCISPSDVEYKASLSTVRFLESCAKLRTRPLKVQSTRQQEILQLIEEKRKLKALAAAGDATAEAKLQSFLTDNAAKCKEISFSKPAPVTSMASPSAAKQFTQVEDAVLSELEEQLRHMGVEKNEIERVARDLSRVPVTGTVTVEEAKSSTEPHAESNAQSTTEEFVKWLRKVNKKKFTKSKAKVMVQQFAQSGFPSVRSLVCLQLPEDLLALADKHGWLPVYTNLLRQAVEKYQEAFVGHVHPIRPRRFTDSDDDNSDESSEEEEEEEEDEKKDSAATAELRRWFAAGDIPELATHFIVNGYDDLRDLSSLDPQGIKLIDEKNEWLLGHRRLVYRYIAELAKAQTEDSEWVEVDSVEKTATSAAPQAGYEDELSRLLAMHDRTKELQHKIAELQAQDPRNPRIHTLREVAAVRRNEIERLTEELTPEDAPIPFSHSEESIARSFPSVTASHSHSRSISVLPSSASDVYYLPADDEDVSDMKVVTAADVAPCEAPKIKYPDVLECKHSTQINEVTPTITGGEVDKYYLAEHSPPLPQGLFLDQLTGVLWGCPTEPLSPTLFVITAVNDGGQCDADIRIEVTLDPPEVSYGDEQTHTVVAGVVMEPLEPTSLGGVVAKYSVSQPKSMAPGLVLDEHTGVLSGIPTQEGNYLLCVHAENASGHSTVDFALSVVPEAPKFTYKSGISGQVGTPIESTVPHNTGGTVASYCVAPDTPLPAGLELDESTGELTGTPTVSLDASQVTVIGRNSAGEAKATVDIEILKRRATVKYPTDVTWVVGQSGTALKPQVEGDVDTFALADDSDPLPGGLQLDDKTGVISGIPDAIGTFTVRVSASNAAGVSECSVSIDIQEATAPSSSSGPQEEMKNMEVKSMTPEELEPSIEEKLAALKDEDHVRLVKDVLAKLLRQAKGNRAAAELALSEFRKLVNTDLVIPGMLIFRAHALTSLCMLKVPSFKAVLVPLYYMQVHASSRPIVKSCLAWLSTLYSSRSDLPPLRHKSMSGAIDTVLDCVRHFPLDPDVIAHALDLLRMSSPDNDHRQELINKNIVLTALNALDRHRVENHLTAAVLQFLHHVYGESSFTPQPRTVNALASGSSSSVPSILAPSMLRARSRTLADNKMHELVDVEADRKVDEALAALKGLESGDVSRALQCLLLLSQCSPGAMVHLVEVRPVTVIAVTLVATLKNDEVLSDSSAVIDACSFLSNLATVIRPHDADALVSGGLIKLLILIMAKYTANVDVLHQVCKTFRSLAAIPGLADDIIKQDGVAMVARAAAIGLALSENGMQKVASRLLPKHIADSLDKMTRPSSFTCRGCVVNAVGVLDYLVNVQPPTISPENCRLVLDLSVLAIDSIQEKELALAGFAVLYGLMQHYDISPIEHEKGVEVIVTGMEQHQLHTDVLTSGMALIKLVSVSRDNCEFVFELSGLDAVVDAMKSKPLDVQLQVTGCLTLERILKHADVQLPFIRRGGCGMLCHTLREHSNDEALLKAASRFLATLSAPREMHETRAELEDDANPSDTESKLIFPHDTMLEALKATRASLYKSISLLKRLERIVRRRHVAHNEIAWKRAYPAVAEVIVGNQRVDGCIELLAYLQQHAGSRRVAESVLAVVSLMEKWTHISRDVTSAIQNHCGAVHVLDAIQRYPFEVPILRYGIRLLSALPSHHVKDTVDRRSRLEDLVKRVCFFMTAQRHDLDAVGDAVQLLALLAGSTRECFEEWGAIKLLVDMLQLTPRDQYDRSTPRIHQRACTALFELLKHKSHRARNRKAVAFYDGLRVVVHVLDGVTLDIIAIYYALGVLCHLLIDQDLMLTFRQNGWLGKVYNCILKHIYVPKSDTEYELCDNVNAIRYACRLVTIITHFQDDLADDVCTTFALLIHDTLAAHAKDRTIVQHIAQACAGLAVHEAARAILNTDTFKDLLKEAAKKVTGVQSFCDEAVQALEADPVPADGGDDDEDDDDDDDISSSDSE